MIRWLVFFAVVLASCTDESIESKISEADRIEMIDNATKFSHIETNTEIVQGFKALMKQTPVDTECDPQGTLQFKKGDKIVLEVGYYKDASACNFLILQKGNKKKGYPLNFNTLAYLGVYFQKMIKKYEQNN